MCWSISSYMLPNGLDLGLARSHALLVAHVHLEAGRLYEETYMSVDLIGVVLFYDSNGYPFRTNSILPVTR